MLRLYFLQYRLQTMSPRQIANKSLFFFASQQWHAYAQETPGLQEESRPFRGGEEGDDKQEIRCLELVICEESGKFSIPGHFLDGGGGGRADAGAHNAVVTDGLVICEESCEFSILGNFLEIFC